MEAGAGDNAQKSRRPLVFETHYGDESVKRLLLLVAVVSLAVGCTDSVRGRIGSLGAKHRIEMYSGGKLVRKWVSTGKPENEANSDGYYFVDSESKELVRVSADVVITQLD